MANFSTCLPWQDKGYYFETLAKALDVYGAKYEKMISTPKNRNKGFHL